MLIPFDELFKRYDVKTKECLHLGANFGQEAPMYASLGISRVVWVEALPEAHAQLAQNIARFPNSVAIRACVSDKDGDEVEFNVANNEGQSSSLLQFGTHSKEHPTVKFTHKLKMRTTRVDTLLSANRISFNQGAFLNIDLQGAELLALKGMGDWIWYFDYAYIEVNQKHLYKGCPLVGDIDNFMESHGLKGREVKWHGTNGWGDKFYSRE